LRRAKISALGCYAPERVLTNAELEKMVETNDQWIVERTGVRNRHIAAKDQATSDLAVEAAREALCNGGVDPAEIGAIIVCTVTPDMMFPSTACIVQDRLGMKQTWGFDLVAACSGFVYGLTTAANLVIAGTHDKILVVGADTMSRIVDYKDRSTCILFGDGAGAMIVEAAGPGEVGYLDSYNLIDGSGGQYLNMPAGGSRLPATCETVTKGQHFVHQDGSQVFKYAVRTMYECCQELLRRNNLTSADVSAFIPHQANRRIITATAERLGIPDDRVIIDIDEYGNTVAATIPLATRDAVRSGRLAKGGTALFAAVGAGYTAGVSLWRWEI